MGTIVKIKKKITKNNSMMAFITLEDMYGSIEMIVFPKILEKYNGLLVQDGLIGVRGRLSIREDDSPKLIPEELMTIDQYVKGNNLSKKSIVNDNTINVKCKSYALNKVISFIRYFEGKNKINVYDDTSGELLFTGMIDSSQEVIKEMYKLEFISD